MQLKPQSHRDQKPIRINRSGQNLLSYSPGANPTEFEKVRRISGSAFGQKEFKPKKAKSSQCQAPVTQCFVGKKKYKSTFRIHLNALADGIAIPETDMGVEVRSPGLLYGGLKVLQPMYIGPYAYARRLISSGVSTCNPIPKSL
ncbi:MAG: hypothetical protein ACK4KT_07970 [Thermaurantimonas sp.]